MHLNHYLSVITRYCPLSPENRATAIRRFHDQWFEHLSLDELAEQALIVVAIMTAFNHVNPNEFLHEEAA